MNLNILCIEDDFLWQKVLSKFFKPFGNLVIASNQKEARKIIKSNTIDIAFIDLDLSSPLEGYEIVKLSKAYNFYPVIISSNTSVDIIEKGYLYGAKDYLIKSGDNKDLSNSISDIFYEFNKKKNEIAIEQKIRNSYISIDPSALESLDIIKRFDQNTSGVFLVGETGTGKKVVADLINDIINPKGVYNHLNCATLNESTIMSELFGHVRGAFTGANSDKKGILENSNDGVLFLDEIHEMPLVAQKALLTYLEDGIVIPLGSNQKIKTNVKIICAAREDIENKIETKKFKDDLYFRLSKKRINLIPLRNRPDDIYHQIEYFLKKNLRASVAFILKEEAKVYLTQYTWPGNTRELISLIESWIHDNIRVIDVDHLPQKIITNKKIVETLPSEYSDLLEELGLTNFLSKMKDLAYDHALNKSENPHQASKILKISRATIYKYQGLTTGGVS